MVGKEILKQHIVGELSEERAAENLKRKTLGF